jgi:hypothetical protein
MNRPSPLRFFWEVLHPGPAVMAALASLLAFATYLATTGEEGFDNALGLVLVAQLLAASTGYRDALVRGRFDGLLAGRERRVGVAFAHAALSMLPGLALWLAFGAASRAAIGQRSFAFTSGGMLAFADASVIVWVVSLWLGRHTGGVLWLVTLLLLAAGSQVRELRFTYNTVSEDWFVRLKSAAAAVVLPIAMHDNGGYVEPPIRVLVGTAILAIFAAGVWTIVRLDAPLRDPS